MRVLYVDRAGKFVLIKPKDISKQKRITMKYAAPYMHEENGMAKRGWRTVVMMKDSLLADNGFPLEFWTKVMDTTNYI